MTTLETKIGAFYDASSGLWERTWGEHMHHGHYGPDGRAHKSHHQAQVDLIEELLDFARVGSPRRILDVGCGIGGSALYMAGKYGASVDGITLSGAQASRANERAAAAGLADQARFHVADAHVPPFPPSTFDFVWSMESGEHMADKKAFLAACFRALAPGGTFVMATWCHRPVPPTLRPNEQALLERIYAAYHLPYVLSVDAYAALAREVGFTDVETDDWSKAVAPFWPAVVKTALQPRNWPGLVRAGWPTIRGALAMRHMVRGFRDGVLSFGVLRGQRP